MFIGQEGLGGTSRHTLRSLQVSELLSSGDLPGIPYAVV